MEARVGVKYLTREDERMVERRMEAKAGVKYLNWK